MWRWRLRWRISRQNRLVRPGQECRHQNEAKGAEFHIPITNRCQLLRQATDPDDREGALALGGRIRRAGGNRMAGLVLPSELNAEREFPP